METSAKAKLVAQGKQLKVQLGQLEVCLDDKEAELQQEAQKIPNLTHPQVCAVDNIREQSPITFVSWSRSTCRVCAQPLDTGTRYGWLQPKIYACRLLWVTRMQQSY